MNRKLITKITASIASLALFAGGITAPAGSILSKLAPEISISAYAWETDQKFIDSTNTFYVQLDTSYVKNGVSTAAKAQIVDVVSSKINKNSIFTIPDKVTVSGKDLNGKNFTVTVPVTAIGTSAFYNEKNLTAVKIPYSVDSIGNDAFRDSGLSSLTIPASIKVIADGAFDNCDALYNVNFNCEKLNITAFTNCDNFKYINNTPIINHNPKTGQPILNSHIERQVNQISSTYRDVKKCPVIQQYVKEYINYIVKANTNTSDSDVLKAKKLHDWLIAHTEYDHEAAENFKPFQVVREDWSPFLYKKSDGKYYAVCAGYAYAYKLLLEAAGIECYFVIGESSVGERLGHAWNIVKIAGNNYHVDTTWDDSNSDKYKYFMRSDAIINNDHNYNWSVNINGITKTRNTGVTNYDLYNLGDVNCDGKVTINDYNMVLNYTLDAQNLSSEQKMRADANLDGKISMSDALCIRSAIAKINNTGYKKSVFEFIYIDRKMDL